MVPNSDYTLEWALIFYENTDIQTLPKAIHKPKFKTSLKRSHSKVLLSTRSFWPWWCYFFLLKKRHPSPFLLYHFHPYTPRTLYIAHIKHNLKEWAGNCLLTKTRGKRKSAKTAFPAVSRESVHWAEGISTRWAGGQGRLLTGLAMQFGGQYKMEIQVPCSKSTKHFKAKKHLSKHEALWAGTGYFSMKLRTRVLSLQSVFLHICW